MLVADDAWGSTDLPRGGVVTIGNYDGIHRGQLAILEGVVSRASELEAPSVVVTFDPHPLAVLRPKEAPSLLTTPEQKRELLEATGVDAMVLVEFDHEVAEVSPEDFVRRFLVGSLGAKEIHVGEDFRFGKDREGDVDLLEELGRELGFKSVVVPEVVYRGAAVSSTRIRAALAEGDVSLAADLLGRPFELRGEVFRGDRMGQRLGWPTVNIRVENEIVPRDGVYATRIEFSGYPSVFDSVTNIGTRPTVYENYQRVVESHVLDFASDVYEQKTKLRFYKRLREERIFPTIMDLSAQIGRDVEASRDFFRRRRARTEAGARDQEQRSLDTGETPHGQ